MVDLAETNRSRTYADPEGTNRLRTYDSYQWIVCKDKGNDKRQERN